MSWPCREVSEFQDFFTHAQTVCTRPFFFLPHAKRASLHAKKKRDWGHTRLKGGMSMYQLGYSLAPILTQGDQCVPNTFHYTIIHVPNTYTRYITKIDARLASVGMQKLLPLNDVDLSSHLHLFPLLQVASTATIHHTIQIVIIIVQRFLTFLHHKKRKRNAHAPYLHGNRLK